MTAAINSTFSAFHDETGRLNVDGMNIISNDGSNKLNRSRKARVSYKVQRTINASLNAATSTRAVSSNHRSEERFSRNAETDLVCRLLLEKKKEAGEVSTFPGSDPQLSPLRPEVSPGRLSILEVMTAFNAAFLHHLAPWERTSPPLRREIDTNDRQKMPEAKPWVKALEHNSLWYRRQQASVILSLFLSNMQLC